MSLASQRGDVVASGTLTYTVTFNEAMKTSNLDAGDFTLHGGLHDLDYAAAAFSYNAGATAVAAVTTAVGGRGVVATASRGGQGHERHRRHDGEAFEDRTTNHACILRIVRDGGDGRRDEVVV